MNKSAKQSSMPVIQVYKGKNEHIRPQKRVKWKQKNRRIQEVE